MDKEQAKSILRKVVNPDVKEAIETLIPEFNESKDDRIRKSLLEFLDDVWHLGKNANFDKWGKADCADWMSYLEKQKEQKSLAIGAASEWLKKHICNYVNSEYNEFHKCVEYDGSIDKERLINDFEKAMQKEQKHLSKFDVDAAFDAREPRDNWEYIKEFCDKFGRMPKDMDELDELVSYVMVKKQKEQKPIISAEESLGISQEECDKIVDECIYGEDKEQKPVWMKIDNSEKNVVFPFKARVKDSDKVVTIIDGQLNFDGKQWIKFASNRDDGFKVYCPEDLLVERSVECIEFDNEFKNQVSHLLASVLNKEWEYNKGFVEYAAQQLLGYAKHEIKPAEWSEEDEEALDMCLDAIPKKWKTKSGILLTKWLKDNIHPQTKREWSEKDEEMYERLVRCCTFTIQALNGSKQYEEALTWLTSTLREFIIPEG